MPEQYLKIRPRPLPSKYFLIHNSRITLFRSYIALATEEASLNKLQINPGDTTSLADNWVIVVNDAAIIG
jgi:hypothetical protein